jgi:hypothetical protein
MPGEVQSSGKPAKQASCSAVRTGNTVELLSVSYVTNTAVSRLSFTLREPLFIQTISGFQVPGEPERQVNCPGFVNRRSNSKRQRRVPQAFALDQEIE